MSLRLFGVDSILKYKIKLKPNKLTFVIVFSNMLLLWMSWFALCSLDVYKIPPAGIVKLLGVLLSSFRNNYVFNSFIHN